MVIVYGPDSLRHPVISLSHRHYHVTIVLALWQHTGSQRRCACCLALWRISRVTFAATHRVTENNTRAKRGPMYWCGRHTASLTVIVEQQVQQNNIQLRDDDDDVIFTNLCVLGLWLSDAVRAGLCWLPSLAGLVM